jgi:hypothetical protein
MDVGFRVLAGLYLLTGIVGLLPAAFLLPMVATALVFWAVALRVATPPVSFAHFLEGAQVAALDAFPDFPLGLAGLGLLALQCLMSFPNLAGAIAMLRKAEAGRRWARRLAVLNLLVFPVGTTLALASFWMLSRPRPAGGPPAESGVDYLVGRLMGAAGALVDRGIDAWNESTTLAVHRSRLALAGTAPQDVRPTVAGIAGAGGFTQRRGRSLDVPLLIMVVFSLLALAGLVGQLVADVSRTGAAGVNWVVAVPALVFIGGFLSLAIFLLGRQVLAGLAHGGELAVSGWPLRPGGESRARLRVKTRPGAKVERIAARFQCVETVLFKDKDSKTQSTRLIVRDEPLPEVTPLPAADASAGVEWTLRLPRDAPASFAGTGTHVSWQLVVDLRVAGAPDGTLSYDLLVLPGSAGT